MDFRWAIEQHDNKHHNVYRSGNPDWVWNKMHRTLMWYNESTNIERTFETEDLNAVDWELFEGLEFNLSSRVNLEIGTEHQYYYETDIKEFIKQIKEALKKCVDEKNRLDAFVADIEIEKLTGDRFKE
jgi:hypothetical protein